MIIFTFATLIILFFSNYTQAAGDSKVPYDPLLDYYYGNGPEGPLKGRSLMSDTIPFKDLGRAIEFSRVTYKLRMKKCKTLSPGYRLSLSDCLRDPLHYEYVCPEIVKPSERGYVLFATDSRENAHILNDDGSHNPRTILPRFFEHFKDAPSLKVRVILTNADLSAEIEEIIRTSCKTITTLDLVTGDGARELIIDFSKQRLLTPQGIMSFK